MIEDKIAGVLPRRRFHNHKADVARHKETKLTLMWSAQEVEELLATIDALEAKLAQSQANGADLSKRLDFQQHENNTLRQSLRDTSASEAALQDAFRKTSQLLHEFVLNTMDVTDLPRGFRGKVADRNTANRELLLANPSPGAQENAGKRHSLWAFPSEKWTDPFPEKEAQRAEVLEGLVRYMMNIPDLANRGWYRTWQIEAKSVLEEE